MNPGYVCDQSVMSFLGGPLKILKRMGDPVYFPTDVHIISLGADGVFFSDAHFPQVTAPHSLFKNFGHKKNGTRVRQRQGHLFLLSLSLSLCSVPCE